MIAPLNIFSTFGNLIRRIIYYAKQLFKLNLKVLEEAVLSNFIQIILEN